jgi:Na+/melibiose symporter-like transporter
MIIFFFSWFLFYVFDGLAVIALIVALGNEELDFTGLLAVGVGTVVLSIFLDLMLAKQFGEPGLFGACGVTALALAAALKLIWDVEFKRVVLICVFFCAFHFGLLRNLLSLYS